MIWRIVPVIAGCVALLSGALGHAAETGSLKVTIPHEEQRKIPVIQVDRSNLRIEERLPSGEKKGTRKKPSSLASRLGEPQKDIHWTPAWDSSGAGSLRLRGVAEAPDRSVLVCLEETGTVGKGPFGGRLLVLDVEGRRILQVFEIGRKLSMIALDAETMSAVCFAEKQEVLSQPSGFAVIRLSDGAESAFVPAEKPESYVARGGWILSASADGTGTAFRPGGSEKKSFRTGKKPRLEFTGDGKLLIAASDDAVRFLETKNFREVRRVALPAGTRLFRMVQGSADGSLVYCSSASDFGKAKVYLVMTGGVKEVADDSTGEIVCNPKDHSFFHGRLLRNRLSRLDPGTFEEVSYCDPKNLRPATSGKTLALFCGPSPGEVIVLDSRGAVYSLRSIRKRWRKTMIVESGMR